MATLGFAIQKFMPTLIDWLMTAFFEEFDQVVFYG